LWYIKSVCSAFLYYLWLATIGVFHLLLERRGRHYANIEIIFL
jgi:hypothetical protein